MAQYCPVMINGKPKYVTVEEYEQMVRDEQAKEEVNKAVEEAKQEKPEVANPFEEVKAQTAEGILGRIFGGAGKTETPPVASDASGISIKALDRDVTVLRRDVDRMNEALTDLRRQFNDIKGTQYGILRTLERHGIMPDSAQKVGMTLQALDMQLVTFRQELETVKQDIAAVKTIAGAIAPEPETLPVLPQQPFEDRGV
jgi:hypothetical protein